jgi:hypothetical protein
VYLLLLLIMIYRHLCSNNPITSLRVYLLLVLLPISHRHRNLRISNSITNSIATIRVSLLLLITSHRHRSNPITSLRVYLLLVLLIISRRNLHSNKSI